jgi:O-6-methylguanine DNA methyltransferase
MSDNITQFEHNVYECTKLIPEGKVSTYKLIANYIGNPNSVRAVGSALKKNPYAPTVPCHRVIKSDGKLGGFFGDTSANSKGIKKKIKLLNKEGITVSNGKVVDYKDILEDFSN